jgi:hypothetical protein
VADQTDLPQPADSSEEETKRLVVDTLAEQNALAALDELIAKVDSGPELSGAAPAQARYDQDQPPPEAYAPTGDAPAPDGWYVAMKDNAQGPFTVDDLRERWSRGEILADTLCWREGMGEWRPLSRLYGLATAIAPRPREGLRALSTKTPMPRAPTHPSGFAPSASNMLRSLAEQEAKSPPPKAPSTKPSPEEAKAESEAITAPRPPAGPTRAYGQKRVPPPAPKPPVFSAEVPRGPEPEEDEVEKRPAGVSGAKLFFSLFTASVLGGLVGGGLVRMTLSPPPAPVVVPEPEPPAPPPVQAAIPAPTTPPPAPPQVQPPKVQPRVEPKVEAKVEPRTEPKVDQPKAEVRPKVAKPPEETPSDESSKPPKKTPPPPPKDRLDKDFEDTFGK